MPDERERGGAVARLQTVQRNDAETRDAHECAPGGEVRIGLLILFRHLCFSSMQVPHANAHVREGLSVQCDGAHGLPAGGAAREKLAAEVTEQNEAREGGDRDAHRRRGLLTQFRPQLYLSF